MSESSSWAHPGTQASNWTLARVLVSCSLGNLVSIAPTLLFTFGVFALAIASDTGWPKQEITAMIGPALLLNMLSQPVCGWIVQRFHKPTIAVLSSIGLAASCVLLAFAPAQPWLFAATLMIANLVGALAAPTIYAAIISSVFDKNRGMALGIASACTGLGVALLPVLSASMIAAHGWRVAYAVLAAPSLIVALLNIFLLRGVESNRPSPQAVGVGKSGLAAAVRQSTFWIMAGLIFLLALGANAIPVHLPLILQERGSSPATGALSLTVIGIVMTLSRPGIGYLIDRLPIRVVLSLMMIGPLAGCTALLLTTGELAALIAAAGFGLAIGGEFVCLGYMVSRAFPLASFGTIYGSLIMALAMAQAIGPTAVSAVVARSGSYHLALMLMMVIAVLALLLSLLLKEAIFRPRVAAETPAASLVPDSGH